MSGIYKVTHSGGIIRLSDNAFIPADTDNSDYQTYLAWVADGNTADPEWDTAELQTRKWNEIKNERDRRILNSGFKVGNYWFHSDLLSRTQHHALVTVCDKGLLPTNLSWKTMSGDFVAMDETLANAVFMSGVASDIAIFAVAENKRAQMLMEADASTYPALTDWPLGYGEQLP